MLDETEAEDEAQLTCCLHRNIIVMALSDDPTHCALKCPDCGKLVIAPVGLLTPDGHSLDSVRALFHRY